MAEHSRLKLIMLLAAMVQLASQVTQLVSEWNPLHSRHTGIEEPRTPVPGPPPWCRDCRETRWIPERRYPERRYYDGRYRDGDDWYYGWSDEP